MRKVAVLDSCEFAQTGFHSIICNNESLICSLMTNNSSTLLAAFYVGIQMDDVFISVQPGDVGPLWAIHALIRSSVPPRVIVTVESAHVPMLQLLRALGVRFILSRRDTVDRICKVLLDPMLSHYISPALQSAVDRIHPEPSRAAKKSTFVGGVELFTLRETDIVLDLLQGISPCQVAKKRCLSVKTVSMYKINAIKKMGVKGLNRPH